VILLFTVPDGASMDSTGVLPRIIAFGAGGAWAVSFLWHLYLAIRYPEVLGDGQYVLVFVFTVPVGWLFGSLIGTVVAYLTVPPPHPALWKIVALIIGGVMASPIVALAAMPLILLTIVLPVEFILRLFR
jgi:hypothetical protein